MPEPYDYISRIQQPDIAGSFLGGLRAGNVIRAERAEAQAAEDARALKAQYTTDLQNTLANPTPQAFAAMTAKYPQQREAFKQSWDLLNKDQQDSMFRAGTQAYSAIQSGRPDVAAQVLDEQIAARENAGQDAAELKSMRDTLDRDPKAVGGSIGLALSSLDPDKWGKIAGEMRAAEQAPFELTEKQAKAKKAAIDANYADANAVLEIQKKGWDITKLQNDMVIAKENSRIAALNANISRETNDLKRQEMQQKVQDAQLKRDTEIRGKVADAETARAQTDNLLNTVDKVLKNPSLPDVLGAIDAGWLGEAVRFDEEELDAIANIDTLGSQVTMSRIGEMKGALSNTDLEVLRSSMQSLSRKQSPKQFNENLVEVQRLALKARTNLASRYGIPDTIPDRPAANVEDKGMPQGFKVLGVEP